MKKILIAIVALAILTFTGCNEHRENVPADDIINSVVDNSSTASKADEPTISDSISSSNKAEEPTASTETEETEPKTEESTNNSSTANSSVESKPEEKPVESTASSSVSSSTASSTTSSSKPANSSSSSKPSSSSTKPVEQPTHTHTFTKATCTTPATCTGCGVTQGTALGHNYKNGKCSTCGKTDPNYVAPHNCATDGHVWGTSTTKTEETWRKESTHNVTGFGFDATLAGRLLGVNAGDAYEIFCTNLENMGIPSASASSTKTVYNKEIKTTVTTVCTVCGHSEETVTTEATDEWKMDAPRPGYEEFDTLFWDPYNIPEDILVKIKIFNGVQ